MWVDFVTGGSVQVPHLILFHAHSYCGVVRMVTTERRMQHHVVLQTCFHGNLQISLILLSKITYHDLSGHLNVCYSSFPVVYKVGNVRIFVQFLMEINRKDLRTESISMQINICKGALNSNWSYWLLLSYLFLNLTNTIFCLWKTNINFRAMVKSNSVNTANLVSGCHSDLMCHFCRSERLLSSKHTHTRRHHATAKKTKESFDCWDQLKSFQTKIKLLWKILLLIFLNSRILVSNSYKFGSD